MISDKERYESMKRIKNIVFDVGKVLIDFDWDRYLESFNFPLETYAAIKRVTFPSEQWRERDRGVLSDEEYNQVFYSLAPEYKKELQQVLQNETQSLHVYEYSKKWIQELQGKGYKTFLLSNISRKLCRSFHEELNIIPQMDGAIFSCEVHALKPELEIYRIFLDTYKLKPEECLFFDDLPENVEAAKRMGIEGIVFKGYEDAIKQLKEYKIY